MDELKDLAGFRKVIGAAIAANQPFDQSLSFVYENDGTNGQSH